MNLERIKKFFKEKKLSELTDEQIEKRIKNRRNSIMGINIILAFFQISFIIIGLQIADTALYLLE